jgi:hypothetical protein
MCHRLKPTPPYNWFWLNNGFTPPTPDNAYLTTTVNTRTRLTAYYSRPVVSRHLSNHLDVTYDDLASFAFTLADAIKLNAFTDTKTLPQAVPSRCLDFTIPFRYTPTTPGTYFLQYTTNTPISLSRIHLVASDISRLLVKQPTTALSIQAPPVVFPSTGSPAIKQPAQTTPIDATDPH